MSATKAIESIKASKVIDTVKNVTETMEIATGKSKNGVRKDKFKAEITRLKIEAETKDNEIAKLREEVCNLSEQVKADKKKCLLDNFKIVAFFDTTDQNRVRFCSKEGSAPGTDTIISNSNDNNNNNTRQESKLSNQNKVMRQIRLQIQDAEAYLNYKYPNCKPDDVFMELYNRFDSLVKEHLNINSMKIIEDAEHPYNLSELYNSVFEDVANLLACHLSEHGFSIYEDIMMSGHSYALFAFWIAKYSSQLVEDYISDKANKLMLSSTHVDNFTLNYLLNDLLLQRDHWISDVNNLLLRNMKLTTQSKILSDGLKNQEVQLKVYSEKIKKLESSIIQLQSDNQQLRSVVNQLEVSNQQLRSQYDDLQMSKQQLEDKYDQTIKSYNTTHSQQLNISGSTIKDNSSQSQITGLINIVDPSSLEDPFEEEFSTDLENLTNQLVIQYRDNCRQNRIRYLSRDTNIRMDSSTLGWLANLDQFLDRECYFRCNIKLLKRDLWRYASNHFLGLSEDQFYYLMSYRVDNIKIGHHCEDEQDYYVGIGLVDNYRLIEPQLTETIYKSIGNQYMIEILRDYIRSNVYFSIGVCINFKQLMNSFELWYSKRYSRLDKSTFTRHHLFNIFTAMSNELPYNTEVNRNREIKGICLK